DRAGTVDVSIARAGWRKRADNASAPSGWRRDGVAVGIELRDGVVGVHRVDIAAGVRSHAGGIVQAAGARRGARRYAEQRAEIVVVHRDRARDVGAGFGHRVVAISAGVEPDAAVGIKRAGERTVTGERKAWDRVTDHRSEVGGDGVEVRLERRDSRDGTVEVRRLVARRLHHVQRGADGVGTARIGEQFAARRSCAIRIDTGGKDVGKGVYL